MCRFRFGPKTPEHEPNRTVASLLGTRLRVLDCRCVFSYLPAARRSFICPVLIAYIWFRMQTPPTFNDQHAWGGQHFRAAQVTSPSLPAQDHTPLPHRGVEDVRPSRLPQGGVIASSSDNLFYPTSHVPSSYVYNLPDVPLNPRFRA